VSFGTSTVGPSSTNGAVSTSTATNGQTTVIPVDGGGTKKSKSGLSTGAIAGIAVGVVILAIIAAILAFLFWRRGRKTKEPQESGDGGLEVGPAPPEYTALKRAELEANGSRKYHEVKPGDQNDLLGADSIPTMTGGVGVGELSAESPQRQELGTSTDETTHAELSGDVESQRAELGSTNSHRLRKPVAGFAPMAVSPNLFPQSQQHRPTASSSWVNSPWLNSGFDHENPPQASVGHLPPPSKAAPAPPLDTQPQIPPPAGVHSTDGSRSPAEADELLRMEEEERRIDEAIAESERLQALRKEKEELQKRMLEARAKNSDKGGEGETVL